MSRLFRIFASVIVASAASRGAVAARSARGCAGGSRLAVISATVFVAWVPSGSAGERESPQVIRHDMSELRYAAPYQAGKVPVVFVHGLFGNDANWSVMIEKLSGDPTVCARFQFLTFRFDSSSSVPDSGLELALALHEARRRVDPAGGDPAFDQVVLVGHSLGGLVSKAASQALDAQCLALERPRRDRGGEMRAPRVGRYVFIATPHRGAPINRGVIRRLGRRLARCVNPSPATAQEQLCSVDQLVWEHPLLAALESTRAADDVPFHSIIAALGDPSVEGATDGVVPVKSAKVEGAQSELIVRAYHFCICQSEVIREVSKILTEHDPRAERTHARRSQPFRSAPRIAEASERRSTTMGSLRNPPPWGRLDSKSPSSLSHDGERGQRYVVKSPGLDDTGTDRTNPERMPKERTRPGVEGPDEGEDLPRHRRVRRGQPEGVTGPSTQDRSAGF